MLSRSFQFAFFHTAWYYSSPLQKPGGISPKTTFSRASAAKKQSGRSQQRQDNCRHWQSQWRTTSPHLPLWHCQLWLDRIPLLRSIVTVIAPPCANMLQARKCHLMSYHFNGLREIWQKTRNDLSWKNPWVSSDFPKPTHLMSMLSWVSGWNSSSQISSKLQRWVSMEAVEIIRMLTTVSTPPNLAQKASGCTLNGHFQSGKYKKMWEKANI